MINMVARQQFSMHLSYCYPEITFTFAPLLTKAPTSVLYFPFEPLCKRNCKIKSANIHSLPDVESHWWISLFGHTYIPVICQEKTLKPVMRRLVLQAAYTMYDIRVVFHFMEPSAVKVTHKNIRYWSKILIGLCTPSASFQTLEIFSTRWRHFLWKSFKITSHIVCVRGGGVYNIFFVPVQRSFALTAVLSSCIGSLEEVSKPGARRKMFTCCEFGMNSYCTLT